MDRTRRPREQQIPAYDLDVVKDAFANGHFEVTQRVRAHLARKGWDRMWVVVCVRNLQEDDFYKSQEHLGVPEVWLDIYRPIFGGERLYVKLLWRKDVGSYLLLSFCVDGEPH